VDFGIGEPREETPAFIREALAARSRRSRATPVATACPELRAAIAAWAGRRFGVTLDPDREVVPTLGSKEAIFHLAQVVGGDLVAMGTPAYPVYERGAAFAGKEVLELPLRAEAGFLPDLDAVDAATWERVGVLWLNYPNNPTAATAPPELYEQAAALAREHEFLVASDEAYSELYFGSRPPGSALQVGDRTNVVVFNTLSKRSSMPGYRTGFVAGDPEVIGALRRYPPNVGVAPLEMVQRAAVGRRGATRSTSRKVRARYRAKRDLLLPVLERAGLRSAGGDATFFLWLDAGAGAEALATALDRRRRDRHARLVLRPAGEGFIRLALVPSVADCERAAACSRRCSSRWRAGRR
jgi:acetylornithine aminotransferase